MKTYKVNGGNIIKADNFKIGSDGSGYFFDKNGNSLHYFKECEQVEALNDEYHELTELKLELREQRKKNIELFNKISNAKHMLNKIFILPSSRKSVIAYLNK